MGHQPCSLDTVALWRIVVPVTTVKLLQVYEFPWHREKDLAVLHKADQGVHNWVCTNIVGPCTHHRHVYRIHDRHMETDTMHEQCTADGWLDGQLSLTDAWRHSFNDICGSPARVKKVEDLLRNSFWWNYCISLYPSFGIIWWYWSSSTTSW